MVKKTTRFIVNKPIKKKKISSSSSIDSTKITSKKPRWVQMALFPRLTEVNQIVRFTAILVAFGLSPAVYNLLVIPAPVSPNHAEVLGNSTLKEMENQIPDFPNWRLTTYNSSYTPTQSTFTNDALEMDLESSGIVSENITMETQFNVEETRSYKFSLNTDSATRVYVDGQLLITKEFDDDAVDITSSLDLQMGLHQIQIEHAMPSNYIRFEFN